MERALLAALVGQLGSAIENARLMATMHANQQALAVERDQLALLHVTAAEVQRANTVADKLQAIADGIRQVGWQRVIISLRDEDLRITMLTTAGFSECERRQLLRNALPAEKWRGWLASEFERFRVGSGFYVPWSDPWAREHVLDKAIRGHISEDQCLDWHPMDLVCIPLYGREQQLIGLVHLDDPVDGRRPTAESMQVIDLFVQEAALTIENAHLHE